MSVRWLPLGLAVLAAALPAPAAAQSGAGTTSGVVLQLAPAPRSLALGGAYAALAADELGIFYNPARLALAAGAVGLAYQTLPLAAGAGSLAAALPAGPGVFGGGVQFLNLGEVDVVEPDPAGGEWGIPTGERVGGAEVALSAGYGVAIGPVQVGAAAKLLRFQLAEVEATGAAFDLAAGAELFAGRLALGVSAQNLGGETGPGRPAPLPRLLRVGAAVRLGQGVGPRALLALEAMARHGRVALATGVEAGIAGAGGLELVGRVGYRHAPEAEQAEPPLVFGAGLALDRFALDYAYRSLGPLGAAHLFGVSIHVAR